MKTKWSLNELARYEGESLMLSGEMDLEKELQKRDSEILSASPVRFEGALSVDGKEYILYLELTYTLRLPSTRSLKPADVPTKLKVSEVYLSPEAETDYEETDPDVLVIELTKDTIDLKETAVENIVAALPSKVLTEEEKKGAGLPEGKGWRVVTEDQAKEKPKSEESGDPRFDALKALFPDEKDPKE